MSFTDASTFRRIAAARGGLRVVAISGALACLGSAVALGNPLDRGPARGSPAREAAGFRLGTAAAPFDWSTAIADLDGDGRADLAIADRRAASVPDYEYLVEVRLSSARLQTLVFRSPHGALTVRVRDVDRDDDLDLVVTPPLSEEVVAVWLNDGAGQFRQTAVDQVPPEWPPAGRVTDAGRVLAPDASLAPERESAIPAVTRAFLARRPAGPLADGRITPLPQARLSAPPALRGPPSPDN
jgi:FG-GAP repeat